MANNVTMKTDTTNERERHIEDFAKLAYKVYCNSISEKPNWDKLEDKSGWRAVSVIHYEQMSFMAKTMVKEFNKHLSSPAL